MGYKRDMTEQHGSQSKLHYNHRPSLLAIFAAVGPDMKLRVYSASYKKEGGGGQMWVLVSTNTRLTVLGHILCPCGTICI